MYDKPAELVVKVGDTVIYCDPTGVDHTALVTAVWPGATDLSWPLVNLVYVSGLNTEQDSYGRQIKRQTSLGHKTQNAVHGQYWRLINETPNDYVAPLDS